MVGCILKVEDSFLNCELPNDRIYNFVGNLTLKGYPKKLSISNKNILLRGTVLKITKLVVGIVVNIGNDTKLMMN